MKRTKMSWIILALAFLPRVAAPQERFASPEAAAKALATAASRDDSARLLAILGPDGKEIISSGDPVADANATRRFGRVAAERTRIERLADGKTAITHVGKDDWPLPIPMVRDGDGWRFDAAEGKQELLNRRIGRNELTTIEVCRAYVDAQVEVASRFHEYAQRFRSTPGKQDGLYWDDADGAHPSPMGPLVVAANAEGYPAHGDGEGPIPYHGYFFRMLTAQGAHAPGGAKSYLKDGKLTGGFALVAWPADHGSSGVMTFLVNQQGVVFQKDLGEKTDEIARAMTAYDPDDSWDPTK